MNDLLKIKELLDKKYLEYNNISFIKDDPVQIPHLFSKKEDIEISAFLTSSISWGNRLSIINNSRKLMNYMDNSPYDFIQNYSSSDLRRFEGFVHRTFNNIDCIYFLRSLKNIYKNYLGLEEVFMNGFNKSDNIYGAIEHFAEIFLLLEHEKRVKRHIPNVIAGSAAKRINMFLRWMIRYDEQGVDFGIWKGISKSKLMLPLDVHTANTARKLGILRRKQNDWKAVEEVTSILRLFDYNDPVKYDFALFGIGRYETPIIL